MALVDILEAIRTEAEQTAAAALDSARAEAHRLLAEAKAQAAMEEDRLSASLNDRARLEESRILSRAHLDAARERRAAREHVYRATLDEVVVRLRDVRSSSRYGNVLADLLDEAIAVLPVATAVHVDHADIPAMREVLAARNLDLLVEEEPCELGGLVATAEGRTVDNTLRSRLDRADTHLRYIAGELIPELRGGPT